MLVFLKEDMGYIKLGNYRIYGKKYSYGRMGPTDIPYDIYKEYNNILECAEYTKEWLDKKFNTEFPDISFLLKDLKKIDTDTLIQIANCVGIKYIKSRWMKPNEIRALCRSIDNIIREA